MEEFANTVQQIIDLLRDRKYPPDFTKTRRESWGDSHSFQLNESGTLQYDGRIVIPDKSSQQAIIKKMHSGVGGKL